MNRGMFESSLVQQMIGGNPSWWSIGSNQEVSQFLASSISSASSVSSSSSSSSYSSSIYPQYTQPTSFLPMTSCWQDNKEQLPESWSQLLLGGLMAEEDRCSLTPFQTKRTENWETPVLIPTPTANTAYVKQDRCSGGGAAMMYQNGSSEGLTNTEKNPWSQGASQALPASSPRSCVTTSPGSNMLDFSSNKGARKRRLQPDQSSECNSTTSSALKKGKVQASAQSPSKVRKEKLGDRVTALHQLVSPFGKTDTASVLHEAIGYIRFLQSQIEALSLPYLGNESRNSRRLSGTGERGNIFQREDRCKDINDEPKKDLRSRGLCLVPVSFMMHAGSDNGADYWAPAFGGEFR